MLKNALIYTLLALMLSPLAMQAQTRRSMVRDSLVAELARANNVSDSLRLSLDIMDLSTHSQHRTMLDDIYRLAVANHNIGVQLELIQRIATHYRDYADPDSLFVVLEKRTRALPESKKQRSTNLFIEMMRITAKSELPDSARREYFLERFLDYKGDDKSSLNEQILHHYAVARYIDDNSRGILGYDNLDMIGNLVRKLPMDNDNMRNLFFTQAAIIHTIQGEGKRAIALDREILQSIERLTARYHNMGRNYVDYKTNIYNCLRRMMTNYHDLEPQQIDSIYNQVMQIASEVDAVAKDVDTELRVKAFYAMAKGRYAEAIPMLQQMAENPRLERFRHIILRELIEAANKTGNKELLLRVMPQYISYLESHFSNETIMKSVNQELDYKLSDSLRQNEILSRESNLRREKRHRNIIYISILSTLILVTLLFIITRLYRSTHRLSSELQRRNKELVAERDKLKKSEHNLIAARDMISHAMQQKDDFINNMSREVRDPLSAIVEYSQFIVDNMDAGRKKYMENFADVVTLSADLLQTLINDALDTSSLERSEIEITRRPIAVNSICTMAMANVHKRVKPGVELIFEADPRTDAIITTDPRRVEQILLNMLSNAAKFTDEGHITLTYEFDLDHSHITFAVTDTGIGIPPDKVDHIFGRFEKLDSHSQGAGLGLYISSLLAKLLGGSIGVDTSYTDGARFTLTIPV